MHQQTYCHTLPKPFFKIFLFRIYASTNPHTSHAIDSALNETSVRHPQIPTPTQPHKPIHQRHCPHTPQIPHTTDSAPIHTPQIPRPYCPTNTQPYSPTNTHSLHKHTASTHTLDAGPPTDVDVDVDADAQTLMQHRCNRSPDALAATHRSAIGQARQTGSD